MSVITDPLIWCVIQITLVGLLAFALCVAAGRSSAAGNALVPAAALAAIVVLTICAFAPWPGWWTYGPRLTASRAVPSTPGDAVAQPAKDPEPSAAQPVWDDSPRATSGNEESAAAPTPTDNFSELAASESDSVETNTPARLTPPAWLGGALALLLGIGFAAGALQLVGGLLSVRACRRRSRPVDDADLQEQLDILQAELGLARHIELRESDRLTTAATCGWWRPMVLVPPAWREWTAEQRRAVLAHELAHVAGGDYLTCVLAQMGLALHFYHPLVHWLVARLRLEQELAADATAAALAGGRRAYLTTLAELALHTQERSLGWPAHTFLPTPGTFLRRIEMLRDSKPALSTPPRRWAAKWLAVGLLLGGAALIAGLRGGPSVSPFDREALAQDQPASASGAPSPGAIDLRYVTNDAKFFVIARPAQVLAQEEVKSALTSAAADAPALLKLLTGGHLQQITLLGPAGLEPNELNDQVIVVLQFDQPTSLEDLSKTGALSEEIRPLNAGASNGSDDLAGSSLNESTLAIGGAQSLQKYLANRRKGKPAIASGPAWEKVQKGTVVAALDMELIRDTFAAHQPPDGDAAAQIGAIAPLWQDSEYLLAGIILEGKQVHFRAVAICDNADLATDVAETTQAAVTLARNSLRSLRERESDAPALARLGLQTAEGLLKTMKVERSETLVVAQTSTTVPDVKSVATSGLVGAVSNARLSAQRQVSMNNLKQIMLAMHSWADVHGGRFPAPVIYGKDGKGKVPHSWRVELLPYLEQAHLYEAYQFDESWDSEANKKVLAQMPPFFRHPVDDAKSTSAGYFVLVPAELQGDVAERALPTAFGKREGVKFAEILDGTSNTLAVVEAKREIPWTRPDDIVFDPEKAPPTLGGFFKEGYNAGLCDGSVRFISGKIEPATLKILISPQGGEAVPAIP
jgi:beta-lactamase regulating signal transducer with metallopeptidase domain